MQIAAAELRRDRNRAGRCRPIVCSDITRSRIDIHRFVSVCVCVCVCGCVSASAATAAAGCRLRLDIFGHAVNVRCVRLDNRATKTAPARHDDVDDDTFYVFK